MASAAADLLSANPRRTSSASNLLRMDSTDRGTGRGRHGPLLTHGPEAYDRPGPVPYPGYTSPGSGGAARRTAPHGDDEPPAPGDRVATKREVEEKLRELIARLAGAETARDRLAKTLPESKVIAVRITDLDADYWTTMRAGTMDRLHRGVPEHADIRIRVSGDQLVAMVDGRSSLFAAFVSGQVKIEASVSDLLRLRRLA